MDKNIKGTKCSPSERCRGQEEEGGSKERAARSRQISARNSKGGNGEMRDPASKWWKREPNSGPKVPP